MWMKKTKQGKVRYCERYTDYLTGKKKDVCVTFPKDTARNRKEAAATLQQMIQDKLMPKKESITLAQLVDEYRTDQKHTVRPSTYQRNYYTLETIKRILGEDVLVDRLNARYIQNKFLASGRSSGTLNELLSRFKALIRWGYKVDLIDVPVFLDKIEKFKDVSRKEKRALKYLESDELRLLLSKMESQEWSLFTEFLALSGLRCGEAIALERKDIDLDNKVIHITKTYNSQLRIVCPAKTENSADDVYIQTELEGVIRNIQSFMKRKQMVRGYRTKLFFSNNNGGHVNYFTYNKYLKQNTLAVVGRELTTHSLRHTHASLLFEQGFTLDEVSRRLRHGDSKVTKEVYIHITKKLKEKDAEKLENVFLL